MLLAGVLVPFALTLLAPIIVNIVGFHLFLAPAGMPLALLVLALELHLAWVNRAAFAPLFRDRRGAGFDASRGQRSGAARGRAERHSATGCGPAPRARAARRAGRRTTAGS